MKKQKKTEKKKPKSRLWLLCVRDQFGIILDIIPHQNYDTLMMEGIEIAKAKKGTWEIYNHHGRLVDGTTK